MANARLTAFGSMDFVISVAYTPSTIPMVRLAEYMAQYARMLGHETSIHFDRLDLGSTEILGNKSVPFL